MRSKKRSLLKRTVRHLSPSRMIRQGFSKRTIEKVVAKYGMVYFGYVNQNSDEHKLTRGFTVSPSQIDNHYCVGTIKNYDVTFVQRNDIVMVLGKQERRCHWLIVTVDLLTTRQLPHVYIGPQSSNEIFEAAYTRLRPVYLGATSDYPHKFSSNYTVYTRPSDAVDVEWLFPPSVAQVIVSYFSNIAIELEDNTLYLYVENQYPQESQIDKMFENGIWLAEQIDAITNADIGMDVNPSAA